MDSIQKINIGNCYFLDNRWFPTALGDYRKRQIFNGPFTKLAYRLQTTDKFPSIFQCTHLNFRLEKCDLFKNGIRFIYIYTHT